MIDYRADEASFYFLDPQLEPGGLKELPGPLITPARKAIEAMLAKYFAKNSVYTLSDDQTETKAAKMLLKSVVVRNGQLEIELGL